MTLADDERPGCQADSLRSILEPFKVQYHVPLARYTAVRLGGPADALVTASTADELAEIVSRLWQAGVACLVIGGGSNLLVSDAGVRGVVVLNRGRRMRFELGAQPPTVWAESGANFGALARQAAAKGLSGLEWAAGIPGTLGGAVVGNAGAHGGDLAGNLLVAEILHHNPQGQPQRQIWAAERFEYGYRTSVLKRQAVQAVVLAATLQLSPSTPQAVQARLAELSEIRRRSQPPGASLGSIFKNPPGDYAGRLIEAAGLKGARIGGAQVSPVHANFFINTGQATARNYYDLIVWVQQRVFEKFGIRLEREIELAGEW